MQTARAVANGQAPPKTDETQQAAAEAAYEQQGTGDDVEMSNA